MALIYNKTQILQFMEQKLGVMLKRDHIKSPTKSGSGSSLMLIKAAIQFRHYTIFIHVWDNYPHLFKRKDLVEGLALAVAKKDKILTRHILNSKTAHGFFNVASFAYKFVLLQESVFNFMQGDGHQAASSNRADKEFANMLNSELSKQPYSFYSYALFYERGNIYDCLRSLEQTT